MGSSSSVIKQIWGSTTKWFWWLLVALLPITSMPLVIQMVHSDTVAAPSGLALLFLVISWLIPFLYFHGSLPMQSLPLLFFALASILSNTLSFFLPIPPFKEVGFFNHNIQAILTLAVGLCFYFVTTTWVSTVSKLQTTYKILNLSGVIIILYSLLQAVIWHYMQSFPIWMETIHRSLVTGVLFKQRVSGFTLEPSWLAHQLNMLFLPFWLAATVKKYSAHRLRIWKFTFENFLLFGGLAILWLTYSRIGLLAFVFMLSYPIIKINLRFGRWIQKYLWRNRLSINPSEPSQSSQKALQVLTFASIVLTMGLLYLSLIFGIAYGLSRFDPRMQQVFDFSVYQDNTILRYANRLDFGPRLVYWMAGWDIFNDFPVFGVGLGNAGYFFPQKLTPYAWSMMEVSEMMYRSSSLTNIKSLWVRILAETGIVGFAFFITWLSLLWLTGRKLEHNANPMLASTGLAGLFVIIGLVFEGFSVDSFALPYFWISLGLVSAGFMIQRIDNKG